MSSLLWNIFLALIWCFATGVFTPGNLAVGFGLSFLILLFSQQLAGPSIYYYKARRLVIFLGFFLKELIVANLRVAYDVVTPTHHMRPAIIGIPLDARTDAEITLLASLITLTPGTLSLDVSPDGRVLYVHGMFVEDPEALRREIKEGLERPLLEIMR